MRTRPTGGRMIAVLTLGSDGVELVDSTVFLLTGSSSMECVLGFKKGESLFLFKGIKLEHLFALLEDMSQSDLHIFGLR